MEFLKKHWSTIILIGILAAYMGISAATRNCPMCVASKVIGSVASDSQENASSNNGTVVANDPGREWELDLVDGQRFSSNQMHGKVGVLVYWATWCAPCKEEIPSLVAMRKDFSENDVSILGISLDMPGKDLAPFIDRNGINYQIGHQNESLESAFGQIKYIPTIFIIDKEGRVAYQHTGSISKEVLSAQIQTLVNAKI